ncbi:hypothetical protein PVK06_012225 [Gossypium arboreum]|uniref:Uncharacterized protein n=1 Tax=Gossypium arboreum TaxID=29729 RepID=A0ABR0QBW2_GOSAR|nr:hypothetical protein PVK06_012225 [Gossypium arboreum]
MSSSKIHEALEEGYDMLEHLDKTSCDSYKMPSCETTKMSNSKILSNTSNMMTQMRKMLQEISNMLPPREEVMHDVPKFNLQDSRIIVDHPKLNNSTQKDFGIKNHKDELNIA